ncbi:CHASE2 domain-containing protein, partial [Acidihalobacter prosperus]
MSRKTTKFRWKKDRFLVLIAIITVATVSVTGNLKSLDKGLFSLFNRLTPINLTSTRIELITVNQKKLESVGDWPLNRANIAHMLKLVASGKPDIIATTLPLDGRQYTAGFREIYHLDSIFKKKGINNLTAVINEIKKNRNTLNNNTLDKLKKNLKDFSNQLDLATKKMDQDSILSQELGRINKIDLAYTYAYTKNNSKNAASPSLHHSLLNNQTSLKISGLPKNKALIQANSLILPLNDFIKNVTGSGAVKVAKRSRTDLDKTPLVISYRGTELPSLALLIAAQNLHTNLTSIHYMPSRHILKLGTLNIHTGQSLTIYPRDYTDGISSYKKFKYIDVLKNKINPKEFRHKIILIGIKNTKSSQFVNASGISLLANQIYSILNQDSVYSPYWSSYLRYSLFFLASIYLLIISPFLGKWLVDATTLIVLFILFLCSFYLFYKNGIWIPLAGPILILLAVYLLFKSKQILFGNHGLMTKSNTHHEKKQLIGLAFQNQGRLDLAYEQYCQLPINEYSLELLYSLGLEYQRSNNSEKARNIYQYIKKHRPEFRDVQTRLLHPHSNRDNRASHLNHYDANTNTGTAILGSYDNKTMMLGRYEVDHEIGRGAMSTVYQGKDPTIGRKVAIKTLLLSNEFEGEELEEVKARFYREAETAGRLSHPNIVTIFDAGEQDDIAYIAME